MDHNTELINPSIDDACLCVKGGFWCNKMKICITGYIFLSSLCIVVLKFINYRYQFVLPMLWAMISETTWAVSFPLYFLYCPRSSRDRLFPSPRVIGICAAIGFSYSISKSIISYSENLLPGSVYAIIASLDILFNASFSRIILRKKITVANMLALVLVTCAVLPSVISKIIIAPEHQDAADKAQKLTGLTIALGIPLAIYGVAQESLSTVISTFVLKTRIQDRASFRRLPISVSFDFSKLTHDDCTENLWFITQYASWVSLFAFIGMLIPLYISGEAASWKTEFVTAWDGSGTITHAGWDAVIGLSLAAAITILTRLYMRCAKYYICSLRTAFTFAVVKPLPRILEIIVLCFLLGEIMTIPKIIGMVLTAIGFIIHVKGQQKEFEKMHAIRAEFCQCHSTVDTPLIV
uniref:EamA domain-containing protein n=1 Tax=Spongospora subterranea TaxID=70186 RepID=A0A0H5R7W1_9EUKA|eukprot:CRZ10265.1 hypothetical protein [Spongospora subterranea]